MAVMKRIRKSKLDIILDTVIITILTVLSISMLYPFISIFAKAFSGYVANTTGRVSLYPIDFQVNTFRKVVVSAKYLASIKNSLFIASVGTLIGVIVSAMAAYALSRKRLRGRSFFAVLFVFTMMFGGGIIPNYILIRSLHMDNTLWALIIPSSISVYNMLILKSSFESLPESLEESAKLDGASNIKILFSIMLPISLPTLAAVSLFFALGFWNEYFNAAIYITQEKLKPLQIYLYDTVRNATESSLNKGVDVGLSEVDSADAIVSSTILASTIPILLVYPFVQKYFVKGIMIGSVKE